MKKLILILSVLAIAFTGCDDETKNLSEKHEALIKESDSITQVYTQLQNAHTDMLETHKNLTTQVEASGIMDSEIMERIASHEVIVAKHNAILESHKMMLESHTEFKEAFDDRNLTEMEVQIEKMRQSHDQIKSEQESIRQVHETMDEDHKIILQRLSDFQTGDN